LSAVLQTAIECFEGIDPALETEAAKYKEMEKELIGWRAFKEKVCGLLMKDSENGEGCHESIVVDFSNGGEQKDGDEESDEEKDRLT
jgi:hypothetical protein